MSTATFDAHEFARALEEAGVSSEQQAEACSKAVQDSHEAAAELAAKADLREVRAEVRQCASAIRDDLEKLETRLRTLEANRRDDMRTLEASLRTLESSRRDDMRTQEASRRDALERLETRMEARFADVVRAKLDDLKHSVSLDLWTMVGILVMLVWGVVAMVAIVKRL